jgi:hypothetical protein
MNIVLSESQFNIENIYFMEPIVNTIMDNSMFIKIIYSNQLITLNGLYLTMNIKVNNSELYFKKIKFTYDLKNSHNNMILNKLYNIEAYLLDKYTCNKTKKTILYDTLKYGMIKIFPNQLNIHNNSINTLSTSNTSHNQQNDYKSTTDFILKISGIWENDTEYGVTYKLSTG